MDPAPRVLLGIRDFDTQEVLRDLHIREDLLRVFKDRRRLFVPRAQVGEDETSDPSHLRDLRRLARRGMSVPVRLVFEGRIRGGVVDEDIGVAGGTQGGVVWGPGAPVPPLSAPAGGGAGRPPPAPAGA